MPARRSKSEPGTESEVCRAVKEALLTAFGDRPLEADVAAAAWRWRRTT